MKKGSQIELIYEILDLAAEQLEEFRKEINFYKASIYKAEIVISIDKRITGLSMIFGFFDDERAHHIFENFRDELDFSNPNSKEDISTSAWLRLASICQQELEIVKNKLHTRCFTSQDFTKRVRSARKSIINLCSDHSSSKTFFSNL